MRIWYAAPEETWGNDGVVFDDWDQAEQTANRLAKIHGLEPDELMDELDELQIEAIEDEELLEQILETVERQSFELDSKVLGALVRQKTILEADVGAEYDEENPAGFVDEYDELDEFQDELDEF